MDAKKKIIMSVAAFAMIIVASVVAVVAVLAAQNVTITNYISVNYVVEDVYANVELSYAIGDSSLTNASTLNFTPVANSPLVFNGDNTTAGTLTLPNQTIKKDKALFIKFKFTNNSAMATRATSKFTITNTNMNVKYGTSVSAITSDTVPTNLDMDSLGTSKECYIKVSVKEANKIASYTGDIVWTLAAKPQA